ncbi:MAG TPA: cytochrome c [Oligoflexia bacterium]|nr:cytochrome c [Oligoflexia bacterium]HMP47993.1 cytochrome c [Oligoflexia bacterium]
MKPTVNSNSQSHNIYFIMTFVLLFCIPLHASADPLIEKGKSVYNGAGACSSCHGPEGAGDGPASAALNPKPANFVIGNYRIDTDGDGVAGTENDIYNIITKGAAAFGGNMMMVPRADLPEEDRRALAKYVISLKK